MTQISDLGPAALELMAERRRGGETVRKLAAEAGVKEDTLGAYFRRNEIGIEVVMERGPLAVDDIIEMQVKHDKEAEGLRAKARRFQSLYNASIRASSFQDEVIGNLVNSVQALDVLPMKDIPLTAGKAHGKHFSIAHVSDIHNGEKVNLEAMGGLSEYSMEIFRYRAGYWVETLLRLIDLRRQALDIRTLHLFADGDWISGLIHDELLKTNQVNVLDQTVTTAYIMAWAIAQISRHFEEVKFSGTPGNHGRNTTVVEYKDPEFNWDYICYQMVAMFLKNYDNVTFDLPKRLWQITEVGNTRWLHLHGHGIKSWAGIPFYGIERARKEMREALAMGNMTFDNMSISHFHTCLARWLPTGMLVMNGCWKGGDEYAMGKLNTAGPPIQMLTTVHEKYGALQAEPIYLQHAEERHALEVPMGAPAIWADATI